MKRLLLILALLPGCDGPTGATSRDAPSSASDSPSEYEIIERARRRLFAEGWPHRLIEVKSRRTGKCYLVLYHSFSDGESMVKLDEWQEKPQTP